MYGDVEAEGRVIVNDSDLDVQVAVFMSQQAS